MAAHTSEINTSSNCSSLAWCHQTPAELGASGPTSLLQDSSGPTSLEQRAARALSVDVQLQVGVEECRGSDSDSMSGSSAAPWGGECWKPVEKQREQGPKRKGAGRGAPLSRDHYQQELCHLTEGTQGSHLRGWQGFNGKSWCERKIWRAGEGMEKQSKGLQGRGGHICLVCSSIQSRARDSKEV